MSDTPAPNPPVAVVTGASRGIGRAVAVALAGAGFHVVAVARDAAKLEQLVGSSAGSAERIEAHPLDLRLPAGIEELAETVRRRWGRVDALVGNAGVLGPVGPLASLRTEELRDVLDVNLLANWRFLRAFDALLRAAPAGRVVMVSSGASVLPCPDWGPYSISKAALDALVRTYAAETAGSSVRVMAVSPGPLRTDMRVTAAPEEDPETLRTPEDIAPWFVTLTSPDWQETGKLFDFRIAEVVDRH